MRIRRPLPEHDQITRLAAERDAARGALRRLQDHIRAHTSQPPPAGLGDNPPTEGLEDDDVRIDRLVEVNTVPRRRTASWWYVTKALTVIFSIAALLIGLIVGVGMMVDQNKAEQRRLSTIEHELIRLGGEDSRAEQKTEHELFMAKSDLSDAIFELRQELRKTREGLREYVNESIEFDEGLDATRRKTAAMETYHEYFEDNEPTPAIAPSIKTSTDNCFNTVGDQRMECLDFEARKSLEKARSLIMEEAYRLLGKQRKINQQGQSNGNYQYQYNQGQENTNITVYDDALSSNEATSVDVRSARRHPNVEYSGSHATARAGNVSGGVLPVREDVLWEMRIDSFSHTVPRLQWQRRE